jgi:hypothetical protein
VHVIYPAAYLLLSLAAVATVAAVWFAVQLPPPTRESRRAAWQTARACFAALAAVVAAACVLGAIAMLN